MSPVKLRWPVDTQDQPVKGDMATSTKEHEILAMNDVPS